MSSDCDSSFITKISKADFGIEVQKAVFTTFLRCGRNILYMEFYSGDKMHFYSGEEMEFY